jgi:hypothetical protein
MIGRHCTALVTSRKKKKRDSNVSPKREIEEHGGWLVVNQSINQRMDRRRTECPQIGNQPINSCIFCAREKVHCQIGILLWMSGCGRGREREGLRIDIQSTMRHNVARFDATRRNTTSKCDRMWRDTAQRCTVQYDTAQRDATQTLVALHS